MSRGGRAGLAALLLLAAALRFGGLSHDLHEGRVYHPDVAKQMRAVQRFVAGEYYRHVGHKDYDGYPLFHAHLVEYLIRVAEPVRAATLRLVGVPPQPGALLHPLAIYWMMLLLNASLSVGAVALVHRIGRENLGAGAAWGAALLMAVSPADVVATHMATGDAATGFFTTLSLLFSLRVLRHGRARDYALAAFTASLGFASKYYAGAAFFALLAAHLARCGPPRSWLSPASLGRLLLAAAAAVAGLVAAIPSLLTHPAGELRDIAQAMLVSSQRLDPALLDVPGWKRYLHIMRGNLPPLARVLGPAVAGGLVVALLRLRRDPRALVLAVGPAAYWFLGVGSRAAIHPVYHVAMAAALFLLAAHALVPGRPAEAGPVAGARPADGTAPRLLRAAGALVIAWGVVVLGTVAAREVWFWSRMDSQRLAAAWVTENVPAPFSDRHGRYTLSLRDAAADGRRGTVYVRGDLAPMRVPAAAVALARFDLERRPLTQFRNVAVDVLVESPELRRADFVVPPPSPRASETGNDAVFDASPGLVRSGKVLELAPRSTPIRRVLVSDRRVDEAWLVARAGQRPARVSASFGGRRAVLELAAGASGHAYLEGPAEGYPSGAGRRYYRLAADAGGSHAQVALATRPAAAGRLLYGIGEYAAALPLLVRGALEQGDPVAAAEALAAAAIAGAPPPGEEVAAVAAPVLRVRDGESFVEAYGVAAAYLDELPYAAFRGDGLGSEGFVPGPREGERGAIVPARQARRRRRPAAAAVTPAIWTPDLLLAPGHYVARVEARAMPRDAGGALTARLTDLGGGELLVRRLPREPAEPGAPLHLAFPFTVPRGAGGVRVVVRWEGGGAPGVRGMTVRPDALANAIALARTAGAASGEVREAAGREPLACEVLVALGVPFEGADPGARARACFLEAAGDQSVVP